MSNNETLSLHKELTDSIKYAKRIQEAVLPSDEFIKSLFADSFVIHKPKEMLSGDFYWVSDAVTKYQEKFIMASVADCTGHGVPGALMSIIGNNYLRLCEREPTVNRPSEALDFINIGISRTLRQEYTKSTIQDGMDMVFVAIDYNTYLLHFAGAKNPIYIVRSGILKEYKGDRHPIGAFVGEEMKKFTNHSIPIQKGDCVYLFSDGYADQFGGSYGKKFMYNRFKNILAQNSHLTMAEQKEILVNTFKEWMGNNEQVDDVCVFGFRI
jgi:serine phosphatase RsbU (regulator of sigma subunit)